MAFPWSPAARTNRSASGAWMIDFRISSNFLKALLRPAPYSHHSVEVKLYLSIQHPAQALNQTGRLMIRLANALNLLKRCSRGHGEGVLVNNLIAGIQFRH